MIHSRLNRMTRCIAALAAAGALAGCAPLIVGGAVIGSSLVATDRRTTGTQVEDQSIEMKASSLVSSLATLGHINVVSYNRTVLVTGEVPDVNEKARVERALAGMENVRAVVNELGIGNNSTLGSQSNDAYLGAKIVATFVDAADLHANAYKVVVERGIVYLMGRVTEREAKRGTDLARSVSGVQKVVQIFEILSEEELANLGRAAAGPAPAAVAVPAAAPAAASAPR